ncbi:hypothetical protein GZH47_25205 [Paenibacillus rhizovicinus]|uniref:DUF7948 domain-containing protein n=1 Tax=Paenibacillus rhizovicinus TaxID=2704463 RepID=A0A6C0P5E8_9BACL|nr:SBBP repeat-containing protein [Paenibacillus rhizovicinus]QHW33770.1 hypothetical protein GZH47_25205 [Paenibacillus rhizovicinus]
MLPLTFVPNRGQIADNRIAFQSQAQGTRFAFGAGKAWMTFWTQSDDDAGKSSSSTDSAGLGQPDSADDVGSGPQQSLDGITLAWTFRGARADAVPEGLEPEPGTFSRFSGSDPARHYSGLPLYKHVIYRELWPDIDMDFYGQEGRLKYDVHVRPGGRIEDILLHCEGANGLRLDEAGNLLISTPHGTLTDLKPVAYQEQDGRTRSLACRFVLHPQADGSYTVGFALEEDLDPSLPLVIDPILAYSSYLGGSDRDSASAMALDGDRCAYVTGYTFSANYPLTPGAFDTTKTGVDVMVTKINPEGTAILYSTFLGTGTATCICVDSSGHAYVSGSIQSLDFPTTPGAFETVATAAFAIFVTKFNPTGTALVYSTFLGGNTFSGGSGIAVDDSGCAYLVGATDSADFPVTSGAFQTTFGGSGDAFVTKFNPDGSGLIYSTFLGGSQGEGARAIAIDSEGNAYVAGSTLSTNFPVTAGAFQTTASSGIKMFVTKLNAAGSDLYYSTYLGEPLLNYAYNIAINDAGNAYITGQTYSANYPVTPGAFNTEFVPPNMAVVTKLNPTGSALVYSTFLGGSGDDFGSGIVLDAAGNAAIVGMTSSLDFPVTPDAIQSDLAGEKDAFITVIDPDGSSLVFSTYLGGTGPAPFVGERPSIAIDAAGSLYVAGTTASPDFPVTPGAFQPTFGGFYDIFVSKIQFSAAFTTGVLPNAAAAGLAASAVKLIVSNDSSSSTAIIRIAAFVVNGTSRITFAAEMMSVPSGTALTRSYNVESFDAFEIQYELDGPGYGDTVVSVFPVDAGGNPLPAMRVLQAEATPIFRLTRTD